MSRTVCSLLLGALLSSPALAAETLPKDAAPLAEADVTAIYAGNTVEWSGGAAYLAPDGKLTAYWSQKGEEGVGEGTWTVKDNEFCYTAAWQTVQKSFDENFCWKVYRAADATWFEETRRSDGTDLKILSKGPAVSKGDNVSKQRQAMQLLVAK
ncbi:MAG: DUF995 domain-containing protein [Bradyrhizobium sp.]